MELAYHRNQIDTIDAQMIPLFEQRMQLVLEIAQYKKDHALSVLQSGREREVLQRAAEHVQDNRYAGDAVRFMEAVMEISRAAQGRMLGAEASDCHVGEKSTAKVGFQGTTGSFSEQALLSYFGEDRQTSAYQTFEQVFAAIERGEIEYGVLPIENSSTGAITQVYDLLGSYGFSIVGERRLPIRHHLLAPKGASLQTIQTVYSHAQGLEQCGRFLSRQSGWELIPYHNTAVSAKRVAQERDLTKAAIAGEQAAKEYDLQIIVPDIQDSPDNTTRFIIIGRSPEPQEANKISLMFALESGPGALYRVLGCFAEQKLNLVKIESRPMPHTLWNDLFYLDFEGQPDSTQVRTALAQLSREVKQYRLLGAYRSDCG